MKNILLDIFGEIINKYENYIVGNMLYIVLDEDRKLSVSFYNTFSSDNYDALKLNIQSKTHGKIHCQIIKFIDLFDFIKVEE